MKRKVFIAFFVLLVPAAALRAQSAPADSLSAKDTVVLTLEQALQIALSENISVKVADREIERAGYARKGSYASLFPQVDGMGSFQRTIKKQIMYMDGDGFDFSSMIGESLAAYLMPLYAQHPGLTPPAPSTPDDSSSSSSNDGFAVGRWNTWSAGVSASMPLVDAQLWKSLKISDQDVELAVEKARSSRLETVTQVKQAYFGVLMAKQAFEVYKSVYENALENAEQVEKKHKSQRASELDLTRARTTLANAIPNVYDAENAVMLSLWQLKAVMGMDLETPIDVAGSLDDYAEHMFYDINETASAGLENNSTLRQLALQAEQLANTVRLQQYASLPSLSLGFSYSMNAMANDFKFSEYQWSPYSYVGISLSIPIFAGGKRANAVRQARVQAAELDLQRINTERQLKISIRQNLNTMETSMKSYGSARSAVESAEKAYAIASKSYDVGRSTLTDLNDAQLALTQARLSVCQAVYNFVVAKANLEGTLGADFIDGDGTVNLNKTYGNE
ncbi:MAG: TolC family protein [Bacteroidales bacterium]|nr:TolC family protein [Bacteroidales bacterium]